MNNQQVQPHPRAFDWHGFMVDAFVLALFGMCVAVILFRGLPEAGLGRDTFIGVLGTVGTLAVMIVQFHRGSSAGSARKDDRIAQMVPRDVVADPGVVVPINAVKGN